MTAGKTDTMSHDDIENLYMPGMKPHWVRPLRRSVDRISHSYTQAWAAISYESPRPKNQPKLVADLETDQFVSIAMSSPTCEL